MNSLSQEELRYDGRFILTFKMVVANSSLSKNTLFDERLVEIIKEKYLNLIDTGKPLRFYAINPPLIPEKPFDIDVAKKQGYYNFPPTGPMYLCASIDSLALSLTTCNVIDLNNYLLKEANSTCLSFEYSCWQKAFNNIGRDCCNVFLVSYMFGTTKECFTNTTEYIRINFPDSIIITGGVQASFDKKEILESRFADIVCSNEGDLQIQYLASKIHSILYTNGKEKFSSVDIQGGLEILGPSNEHISSGNSVQPSDFDWNINKYYEQIDISSYHKYGGLGAFSKFVESMSGQALPYSAVLTKRGCRAHCAFCTVRTFNGKGLRLRKIDAVVDEIRYLYSIGIRHIDWLDDDLLYNER